MKIDAKIQATIDPTFPLAPLRGFTGSAVLVELAGIPGILGGGVVDSLAVSLVTPDGMPVAGFAEKVGAEWHALFAAANFTGYGNVRRGFKATATILRNDGTTFPLVIGVGNLEIAAGTPEAHPGDPSKSYAVKGSDIYCKSYKAGDVQHYVKQVMEYDPEIGWGANWTGDYVLEDGDYVPYEAAESEASGD